MYNSVYEDENRKLFDGKLAHSTWGLTFIFDDSHDTPKPFELHALNTDQNMDLKFFPCYQILWSLITIIHK